MSSLSSEWDLFFDTIDVNILNADSSVATEPPVLSSLRRLLFADQENPFGKQRKIDEIFGNASSVEME